MVEHQYRTFGRRAGAYLLDWLPFYGLQQLSGLFSSYFASFYFGLAWAQFLAWAWIAYRVLTHGFWGQTLGKKICKVQVVDLSGQRLSMRQAFLREIVPIALDLASLVYLILNLDAYKRMVMGGEPNVRLATAGTVFFWAMNLWWLAQIVAVHLNDRRRAIHDYIAGSVVLRLDVRDVGAVEHREAVAGKWLSSIRGLGRTGMAAIAAILAAATTLIGPTFLLLSSGGEICPGYKVDVSGYYLKLAPLALGAALFGAVLGGVIDWPGALFAESERRDRRLGCGVAAAVIGGVGLAVTSCFLAIIPGC
jgi:uncharacterized RDD family membrane protein YckC